MLAGRGLFLYSASMDNEMLGQNRAARGRKGGLARTAALSPTERSSIAREAAKKRWSTPILRASHGSPDQPLRIGDIEIGCYVLEDGTRVLSQTSVVSALGKRRSSPSGGGGDNLATFVQGSSIAPFVSPELFDMIAEPLKFRPPHGGNAALGFPAAYLTGNLRGHFSCERACSFSRNRAISLSGAKFWCADLPALVLSP